MKYKIESGSNLYDSIIELFDRINNGRAACKNLFGDDAISYYLSSGHLSGPVVAVVFKTPPNKKLWKKSMVFTGAHEPRETRANDDFFHNNSKIPVITSGDMNQLLGFKPQFLNDGSSCNRPAVAIRGDIVLVNFPEWVEYEPIDGMKEILVSEWKKLNTGK